MKERGGNRIITTTYGRVLTNGYDQAEVQQMMDVYADTGSTGQAARTTGAATATVLRMARELGLAPPKEKKKPERLWGHEKHVKRLEELEGEYDEYCDAVHEIMLEWP